MAERHATVTWHGSLREGHGTIDTGSGALHGAQVTWASRMEAPNGKTSPEELLAAAEAECYAMVLTNMLTERGNQPQDLQVTATARVEPHGQGLRITSIQLEVQGQVSGIDQATFQRIAQEAESNCPVSNALRGNVNITVQANLAAAAGR